MPFRSSTRRYSPEKYAELVALVQELRAHPEKWGEYTADAQLLARLRVSPKGGQILWLWNAMSSSTTPIVDSRSQPVPAVCPPSSYIIPARMIPTPRASVYNPTTGTR